MTLEVLPIRSSGFPDPAEADTAGLLAVGGDLSMARLVDAYSHGIFPWFNDDAEPILWWSPDPRAVLRCERLKISRSLRKRLKRREFDVSMDTAFRDVVAGCAAPRSHESGTWITAAMASAYGALFDAGIAHSVEAWRDGKLVGGLYGVSLGRLYFGESMFAEDTDASKVAFVHLVAQLEAWQFELIDCQIMNDHLASLGATTMPRRDFLALLADNQAWPTRRGRWHLEVDVAG